MAKPSAKIIASNAQISSNKAKPSDRVFITVFTFFLVLSSSSSPTMFPASHSSSASPLLLAYLRLRFKPSLAFFAAAAVEEAIDVQSIEAVLDIHSLVYSFIALSRCLCHPPAPPLMLHESNLGHTRPLHTPLA